MKRHNLYSLTVILLLLLTAFSCSKDPKVDPVVPKGRTILVYLALDNSLSNEMRAVHTSLMKGWGNSDKEGSLLLFADSRASPPSYKSPLRPFDWQPSRSGIML